MYHSVVKLPRLVEFRAAKLITQAQLAEMAGVSRVAIARIERGAETRPTTANRLATALGVEVEELVHHAPTTAAIFAMLSAFMQAGATLSQDNMARVGPELDGWLKATHKLLSNAGPDGALAISDAMKVTIERIAALIQDLK